MNNNSAYGKPKLSDRLFDILLYTFAILILITIIYPLYFVVIASISNTVMVAQGDVILFPKGVSFYGYEKIFENSRIWTGYKNTIFYTVAGTIVNLMVTLPAAYALSHKPFKARRGVMLYFIFTMFFNGGLIPTYLLITELNLDNSVWVFILPSCLNVFNLIIARSFFENTIPMELFESAELDGCSHFKFFIRIVLPLSKAVISVITLYYAVFHWNDFFTGLIYIRDRALVPLQLVLRDILIVNEVFTEGVGMGGDAGGYAQTYADTVKYGVIIVSTLPIIVVYPFLQKYFQRGVMIGAIKG